MILFMTIIAGLTLFQTLIIIEATRRLLRDYREAMRTNWFRLPRQPRSYQRRTAGVLTLDFSMPNGVVELTSHTDADFDIGDFDPYLTR